MVGPADELLSALRREQKPEPGISANANMIRLKATIRTRLVTVGLCAAAMSLSAMR